MMKRVLMTGAALIAAAGLAACHKTGANANQDVSNPGQSAPVNTAQDVASTAVGMGSAAVNGLRAEGYVPAAAIADMYEIQAAKIAEQRGKDPQVKQMAAMIIKDHTDLSNKMKAALPQAGVNVQLPTALDERRQGMIDNLKAAGDADFDLAYLHQQLAAHTEALALHQEYAKAGDNPTLKTLAEGAVPVIQKHLDMVRKAGGSKLNDAAPGGGSNDNG